MDSNEASVDKILDQMQKKNNQNEFTEGLTILGKLIANIIGNPFDNKYRTVKISNNTIKTKVMNLRFVQELLLQLGYVQENEESYVLKDERIGDFLQGAPAIDYRKRLLIAKATSPEAYRKEQQLIKYHKQQQSDQAIKDLQSKRLKQQCQNDKKERMHMKADESKSNNLKFGTNTTTWKDIGVDLCAKKGG